MSSKSGYTLLELVVTMAIVAALVGIAVPEYYQSVENAKALSASSTTRLVGLANKSYQLDHGIFTKGKLTDACNTACCAGRPGCGTAPDAACNLIACGYMPKQDFGGMHYVFSAADNAASCGTTNDFGSPNLLACGVRKRCVHDPADPHCIDESAWPYRCWGYAVTTSNILAPRPNPKSPPPML